MGIQDSGDSGYIPRNLLILEFSRKLLYSVIFKPQYIETLFSKVNISTESNAA